MYLSLARMILEAIGSDHHNVSLPLTHTHSRIYHIIEYDRWCDHNDNRNNNYALVSIRLLYGHILGGGYILCNIIYDVGCSVVRLYAYILCMLYMCLRICVVLFLLCTYDGVFRSFCFLPFFLLWCLVSYKHGHEHKHEFPIYYT